MRWRRTGMPVAAITRFSRSCIARQCGQKAFRYSTTTTAGVVVGALGEVEEGEAAEGLDGGDETAGEALSGGRAGAAGCGLPRISGARSSRGTDIVTARGGLAGRAAT